MMMDIVQNLAIVVLILRLRYLHGVYRFVMVETVARVKYLESMLNVTDPWESDDKWTHPNS
jgi:hypothetical protein